MSSAKFSIGDKVIVNAGVTAKDYNSKRCVITGKTDLFNLVRFTQNKYEIETGFTDDELIDDNIWVWLENSLKGT